MKTFFLAWEFLTILPGIKSEGQVSSAQLSRSMAFFPAVGFLLGLVLWAAYLAVTLAFPRFLADGLILLLLVILTGAFHLDGLADTLDGLAFGKSPEDRLRIMKDHRVGTFGVVGLIMILGVKYAALHALSARTAPLALWTALILSRGAMVQLLYYAPYARAEGGLGRPFKEGLGKREVVVAWITSLALSFIFFRFRGVILWLVAVIFTLWLQKFFAVKIGGVTGDVLGASNEANEVLTLIVISGMEHLAK